MNYLIFFKRTGLANAALFAFVFSIALFLSIENRVQAAPGEHAAGLGVGQVLMLGDFAKNFDNALALNAIYTYEASSLFGVRGIIHYGSNTDATGNNTLTIKGASPNLQINLAFVDKLTIYSLAGFGIYMVDQKLSTLVGSGTTLGLNIGAGFDLTLAKHFKFGTSFSFHNIFGKTDSSTVTETTPNGLNIGGTYMALFLNVMYVF